MCFVASTVGIAAPVQSPTSSPGGIASVQRYSTSCRTTVQLGSVPWSQSDPAGRLAATSSSLISSIAAIEAPGTAISATSAAIRTLRRRRRGAGRRSSRATRSSSSPSSARRGVISFIARSWSRRVGCGGRSARGARARGRRRESCRGRRRRARTRGRRRPAGGSPRAGPAGVASSASSRPSSQLSSGSAGLPPSCSPSRAQARRSSALRRTDWSSTWRAIANSHGAAEPPASSRKRARASHACANVSAVRSCAASTSRVRRSW